MEALLFALIIVRDAHRRPQTSVHEPHLFQSLDLQALRQVYGAKDNSPSPLPDFQESYAAQALS
jgi:hypothetical protein